MCIIRNGRASHQAGKRCRVNPLEFSLAPQAMSLKLHISINHTQGILEAVHLHVACLASTNDVLPALGGMLNKCLGTNCTTHPAGPTTKTARVLETRPDGTAENLPRLSPEPAVDCWSRDRDVTLPAVLTVRCKEVATEPSLDIASLWSSAPPPLPEPVYWEPDDVKT
jgi:hypothetical protein